MASPLAKRLDRLEGAALNGADGPIWSPLPGPQTLAYETLADVVGFGGSAGGGKTDLAIGKALTQHQKVSIFRRHSTEMLSLVDRVADLIGTRDGLNQVLGVWRLGDRQLEFGSVPNPGDERKFQGRPRDLLVIDEAANFLELQVRFLMGWVRTTDPKQRCQTLMCFNPPTNAEGRWVVKFFAPWLDKKHPRPALPGELRWFAVIDGEEVEVETSDPIEHKGERLKPSSRTFIPSRISDNPYLARTGYETTLQALPEPLRSQMLHGDFNAGMEDAADQVIPTEWVEAAMERWKPLTDKPPMDSIGVDIARGGRDATIIARRHGQWFDRMLTYPGTTTPDGPTVAGLVISAMRDAAPIHLDVIGVGASPFDFLVQAGVGDVLGINVSETATGSDQSGRLRFFNLRSQLVWRIREALDPANNRGIALPPERELLADLCAYSWRLQGNAIKVEGRDEIVKRIGRSPDHASALMLAMIDTPKRFTSSGAGIRIAEYDPIARALGEVQDDEDRPRRGRY